MNHARRVCNGALALAATVVAASLSLPSHASQGLAQPVAESWWPHWQARLGVLGAPAGSQLLTGLQDRSLGGLALQPPGASIALLGDYYFARPAVGQFRASGGLLLGPVGSMPLAASARLSGSLGGSYGETQLLAYPQQRGGLAPYGPSAQDGTDPSPYVGLGYAGTLWRDTLLLNADLGLVSERPAAAGNVSRALFGNQGMSQALRDLRVSPVLQLGMRYRF